MNYLLDTNAVSLLMREDERISAWLLSIGEEDRLLICAVVKGEILFGIQRLDSGQRRNQLEAKAARLFAVIPCEAIPAQAAEFYATVKANQQKLGLALDENDLWIAATAMALGANLVSRDRDFSHVENLPLTIP